MFFLATDSKFIALASMLATWVSLTPSEPRVSLLPNFPSFKKNEIIDGTRLAEQVGLWSERPVLGQDVGQGDGDGEEAEDQVGDGQGGDEGVSGCVHFCNRIEWAIIASSLLHYVIIASLFFFLFSGLVY